ncbi:MAG: hypothetical protein RSF70_07630 [Ruthenibacterium sp.]
MTDLSRKLAQNPLPQYDLSALQHTVNAAKQALELTASPQHTSSAGQFFLAQMRFISKQMWALQGVFLLCTVLLITFFTHSTFWAKQIFPLLAIAAPLLILINITDFARFYSGGMLEIEMATRFSLQKVAAAKLLIFGCSDALLLLILAAFSAASTQTGLFSTLLVCLVPFNCMCCGCMILLQKCTVAHFTNAAVCLAAALGGAVFLLYTNDILIASAVWYGAFFITSIALYRQIFLFFKTLPYVIERI